MEHEADNSPTFRTMEDAFGRGARLHVPASVWARVRRSIANAVNLFWLAAFSATMALAILILGLSAMDVVLGWVAT